MERKSTTIRRAFALIASAILALALCPALALAGEGGTPELAAGSSEALMALSATSQPEADSALQAADLRADGSVAQLGAMASDSGDNEPNDTESQAVVLPIGKAVTGTFYNAYDVDFYKITLPGAGKMAIRLAALSSMDGAKWRVDLYNSSHKVVASAIKEVGDEGMDLIPAKSLKAGTYYIKVNNPSGYASWDSRSQYLLIPDVTMSVAGASVASVPNKIYTGKAFKPSPTVKLGGKALVKDTDYTLSYKNNVKVGTATVTVKGIGHYTGTKSVTFKIFGKPSYAGASSMPVKSTAAWVLKNCTLKVISGTGVVSVKGNVVTAKKAGVAKLGVFNKLGKQVATRQVSVYKLSGAYLMQSCMKGKSNMCLDMEGEGAGNGVQMIVWGKHGRANQQFTFALQSDGSYMVKSVNSGKYLDVNGASKAWGQNVIQWQRNGDANQRWRIKVDTSNRLTFVNVNSGLVFDVEGGKADWGARMIQWGANGGLNQKWKLVKAPKADRKKLAEQFAYYYIGNSRIQSVNPARTSWIGDRLTQLRKYIAPGSEAESKLNSRLGPNGEIIDSAAIAVHKCTATSTSGNTVVVSVKQSATQGNRANWLQKTHTLTLRITFNASNKVTKVVQNGYVYLTGDVS